MARFIFLLMVIIVCGCTQKSKQSNFSSSKGENHNIRYSKRFSILDYGKFRTITITDPWEKSKGISFDYYLVDQNIEIPAELKDKSVIRTPVKRVICLSTSHIGFLSALRETATIVGLSGANYASDPEVQKLVHEGKIPDVGYDQGINYEQILRLKPDIIFAYGVGSEVSGFVNKLQEMGLRVVLIGEYLENTPLAKAEWIKFIGAFYNKSIDADDYFTTVEKEYKRIREQVSTVSSRPVILTGLPFKDAWWMAGGNSNVAALINDAGGQFIWKDNSSSEAFVVSMEEVAVRAQKANIWINCGTANSVQEIVASDIRFQNFPQVQKKDIYNNNLKMSQGGGNDYWESGVVRPDLIITDLVRIFHPEIDSCKTYNFYKKIE